MTYKKYFLILFTAPKIFTPKDSKRSLKFSPKETSKSESYFNLSSESNGDVFPLSQTSVVSFNLDDDLNKEV